MSLTSAILSMNTKTLINDQTELEAMDSMAVKKYDYLENLAYHQQEPILLIEREPLAIAMREFGAKGISVADVMEPFQMHLSLYIGVTTPQATTEVPHWHNDQTEAYVIIEGQAEISAKHRWIDDGWLSKTGRAGDLFIIQPQVCHWFRWLSVTGLALVFKAPQRAGVGPFPAGKVVCKFCPHFNRGCKVPEDFMPRE
jgi:mannose-6-phosphate isomerase-like protein (cupin superfamily)